MRNAKFGGWGDEERDIDDFPFSPGEYFDALIVAIEEGYAVSEPVVVSPLVCGECNNCGLKL